MLQNPIFFLLRLKNSLTYLYKPLTHLVPWLVNSREITNYTYDLTKMNEQYLASLISHILNVDFNLVLEYMEELKNDTDLVKHIQNTIDQNKIANTSDKTCKYGKRLGWYAIARITKPKVIVETGVDKGFGSCVLTSAIMKNIEDGYEGIYYGTDINEDAGFMLSGKYSNHGKIIYGDSIDSLKNLSVSIDLFINDSDHSSEYEENEYKAVSKILSDDAIILGDNSHVTDKLLKYSLANSRNFVFFHEEPLNHWYPGGGIGISFIDSKDNDKNLNST